MQHHVIVCPLLDVVPRGFYVFEGFILELERFGIGKFYANPVGREDTRYDNPTTNLSYAA